MRSSPTIEQENSKKIVIPFLHVTCSFMSLWEVVRTASPTQPAGVLDYIKDYCTLLSLSI